MALIVSYTNLQWSLFNLNARKWIIQKPWHSDVVPWEPLKMLMQSFRMLIPVMGIVPEKKYDSVSYTSIKKCKTEHIYDLVPKGAHARVYALQLKIKHC